MIVKNYNKFDINIIYIQNLLYLHAKNLKKNLI